MQKRWVNLGKFLREKRKSARLTQVQVGRLLGFGSSQFVNNWERGISAPPLSARPVLVDIYRLKRDELYFMELTDMKACFDEKFDVDWGFKKTRRSKDRGMEL